MYQLDETLVMTAGTERQDKGTDIAAAGIRPLLSRMEGCSTAHRMRLLYITISEGWPAALYYVQHGAGEFVDVPQDFWYGFHGLPTAKPRESEN